MTIHTKSLDRSETQQLTTKTTHERIILYLIAPSFVTRCEMSNDVMVLIWNILWDMSGHEP